MQKVKWMKAMLNKYRLLTFFVNLYSKGVNEWNWDQTNSKLYNLIFLGSSQAWKLRY